MQRLCIWYNTGIVIIVKHSISSHTSLSKNGHGNANLGKNKVSYFWSMDQIFELQTDVVAVVLSYNDLKMALTFDKTRAPISICFEIYPCGLITTLSRNWYITLQTKIMQRIDFIPKKLILHAIVWRSHVLHIVLRNTVRASERALPNTDVCVHWHHLTRQTKTPWARKWTDIISFVWKPYLIWSKISTLCNFHATCKVFFAF